MCGDGDGEDGCGDRAGEDDDDGLEGDCDGGSDDGVDDEVSGVGSVGAAELSKLKMETLSTCTPVGNF